MIEDGGGPGNTCIHSAVVHSWHLDQFGHMNVRWYAHFFDDALWLLWDVLGLDQNRLQSDHACHTVTAKSTTTFLRECLDGDLLRIEGVVTRIGRKSVSFQLVGRTSRTNEVHATCDVVEVFVEPETHVSKPIPDQVREQLAHYTIVE